MAFIEKGQEIDIEAIKAETRLSAETLQHKENRDQELADILSGKDDRILLVIGPCSSDNEEAVLEYARRLADLQKKVADKFSWSCVFTRPNHVPMEMATRAWFISQILLKLQA